MTPIDLKPFWNLQANRSLKKGQITEKTVFIYMLSLYICQVQVLSCLSHKHSECKIEVHFIRLNRIIKLQM